MYIDRIKYIYCKVHGIADNEMLEPFTYELEPISGHEVLKENLQTFEKACVLAERIL